MNKTINIFGKSYNADYIKELVEADKEDRVVSKTSVLRLYNMLLKLVDEQDEEDRQEDVSFATYNQIKWERDIALSQLENYGIGFGEDKNPDFIKVTRCKDCQYFKDAKINNKGFLICPASERKITENDYCSYAEKENTTWK